MDDINSVKHVLLSVNWSSETFLASLLLGFYFSCILLTYITWKRINVQTIYFIVLCAGIYFAEYLNELCAKNWKTFSPRHQFFDSRGLFISVVYSVPLLLNLIVIVLHWMKSASSDLISLKRQQIREQLKNEQKKKN